ncbi:MAG: MTH1187 family thiamine-binding protein [Deltaproteobacteria bacterium]
MSVIVEFSIFPMDKGESLSPYVARALKLIQDSGLPYELNPMGTCVEGEWKDVMSLVDRCFQELQKDCNRINLSLKADYRKGPGGRLKTKIESVRAKLAS